jgi:transposase-like protein
VKVKDMERLKSLLNAAGAALEAAFDIIAAYDDQPLECEHPKDKRNNFSTMGVERWKCQLCGYFYEEGREGK